MSGVPSTLLTAARRGNLLDATRAVGTLLGKRSLVRGVAAHFVITAWWTAVLAAVLPRRRAVVEGAVAGVAIAAVDLGLVARRWFPALAELDPVPQVLDHIAFGITAATALARETA